VSNIHIDSKNLGIFYPQGKMDIQRGHDKLNTRGSAD